MKTLSASMPRRKLLTPGVVITAVWIVTFFGARIILDKELGAPQGVKIAAALAPIIPTALFLWVVVTAIRGLDELHRKVHLEALAIAFPLSILMLVTLGLLQLAIDLPPQRFGFRDVWPFLPCFYFGSLAFTWRRYQ